MKNNIKGIHHIALKCPGVESYDKTVSFYRDILELPVARSWGEGLSSGIMLDTGAGMLEIFANGEGLPTESLVRHFAFEVEDTDACIETVRSANYEITMEPTDIVINSNPPYPARIAFCKGPLGEEIEFFKVK